jgi:hypothetical protein
MSAPIFVAGTGRSGTTRRSRRAELFDRLGLPDAATPSGIEPGRVAHRGRRLSPQERRRVQERLGFAIKALGYAD